MNLAVLKKTRRRPVAGDIFAMLPPDNRYLFGRVVRTDANVGGFPNSNLIYIYRARSTRKDDVPFLCKNELLLPPGMTNNLPWSKGYFEFVKHEELGPDHILARHCFRDIRGWYFDEEGHRLAAPVETPVGTWGLHSYRTIDDEVSRALGIPLADDS
jgi:hypothetical protein